MAFAAKTAFNPMSVATNGCLISSPSLFAPAKISSSHPYISIPYKTAQFKLYCKPLSSLSLTSFFSLKKKESVFSVCVFGENNPAVLEEFEGDLSWDASENGVEGEDGGFVDAPPPPEGAKVYVANLPYDVDGDRLAELFEQAGVVELAEVVTDKMSGQSRGFAFVTMSSEEEANRAVEMLNRYDMGGRPLIVNIVSPKGSRPERAPRENGCNIYVGNIPWTVDSSTLEEMFSEYGTVVTARVVTDRETGRSRGFGFVEMSNKSEMNDAIANLDGQSLEGRAIRVNAAEERPPRRRF